MGLSRRFQLYERAQGSAPKLIEKAVYSARSGDALPALILLARRCQKWNALPDSGGYLDQDSMLLNQVNVLTNIYDVVLRVSNLSGEAIHSMNLQERLIIRWLRDQKYW